MAKRKVRDPNRGTEFGGQDGLVQPGNHIPRPREVLIGIHQRKILSPRDSIVTENDMRNDDALPASTDQYKDG